jgi:hypothetical protein
MQTTEAIESFRKSSLKFGVMWRAAFGGINSKLHLLESHVDIQLLKSGIIGFPRIRLRGSTINTWLLRRVFAIFENIRNESYIFTKELPCLNSRRFNNIQGKWLHRRRGK